MERAKPNHTGSPPFQCNEIADHIGNLRGIEYKLYGALINHHNKGNQNCAGRNGFADLKIREGKNRFFFINFG